MTSAGSGRAGEVRIGLPLAGPQQLGDLRVRAALDELADRVAAVLEAAGLAVDHGERRLAGQDALQPGRVGAFVGIHRPSSLGDGARNGDRRRRVCVPGESIRSIGAQPACVISTASSPSA